MSNLVPFAIVWALLVATIIVLAVMRKFVADKEDDTLHVSTMNSAVVSDQTALAQKLETIDKWGKGLTILAVVTGLALAGAYVYQLWEQTSNYSVR
ncbi:MAG TPA: hypothetical protein DEH78_26440 [Solibacterales bacterium]|nr:hypothetical protein [Bryobacterales bacterium]